jgi:8-oxo-dGTP diphosphatase
MATPRRPKADARPDEAEFLAAYRPEAFARPSVAVDIVAFTMSGAELRVLLIRRAEPPFRGYWALPGGFVRVGDGKEDQGESLEVAVGRELEEETGLRPRDVYFEQLGAFGEPYRDPRMRIISVAYYALVRPDLVPRAHGGGDASRAEWVDPNKAVRLAFDHAAILEAARTRVRERIRTTRIAASLLPETFTIPEIRHVVATVTGEEQDPGNFRRRFHAMLEEGLVEQAPGKRVTASKPAAVYRFR